MNTTFVRAFEERQLAQFAHQRFVDVCLREVEALQVAVGRERAAVIDRPNRATCRSAVSAINSCFMKRFGSK